MLRRCLCRCRCRRRRRSMQHDFLNLPVATRPDLGKSPYRKRAASVTRNLRNYRGRAASRFAGANFQIIDNVSSVCEFPGEAGERHSFVRVCTLLVTAENQYKRGYLLPRFTRFRCRSTLHPVSGKGRTVRFSSSFLRLRDFTRSPHPLAHRSLPNIRYLRN